MTRVFTEDWAGYRATGRFVSHSLCAVYMITLFKNNNIYATDKSSENLKKSAYKCVIRAKTLTFTKFNGKLRFLGKDKPDV